MQFERALGSPTPATRATRKLREAAEAYSEERYGDAQRLLKPLAAKAPSVAAVRELLGLTYYRSGRWKEACGELEAFRTLTDSTEQHPVLADCNRALGRYGEVATLWEELAAASPDPDLVAEGRIVAAAALADQGDVRGGIRMLERSAHIPRRPAVRHLRLAYALADLYERGGELPRAREWFSRVRSVDPDFADIRARLRALGS